MLEQLLERMRNAEGALSTSTLARELGTSEALVEAMLENLVRLGYVEAVTMACASGACGGCSMAGQCASGPQPRMWQVRANRRGEGRPYVTSAAPQNHNGHPWNTHQ